MGSTQIPNYEPDDQDWSVVCGPFIRVPVEDVDEQAATPEDDE